MNKFFDNPFIPDKKVNNVIIDGRTSTAIVDNLKKLGIDVILTEKNLGLYEAIAYHPDILLHPVSKSRIVVNPQVSKQFTDKLKALGCEIIYGKSILSSNYPLDIAYNVARVGILAFHNLKHTDSILREELEKLNIKLVNVSQGYTKCSAAIVSSHAIITSDHGIAKAADNNNIDVLVVDHGEISLPGLNYGFIGGSCGLISQKILAFTGRFLNIKTYEKVCTFLEKHNIEPLFLSNNNICDIGSILPIVGEN